MPKRVAQHRWAVLLAGAVLVPLASCLPLPTATLDDRCASQSSYAVPDTGPRVAATVDLPEMSSATRAIVDRLTFLPTTATVGVSPVLTVRLAPGDAANDANVARLRTDFGSTIDIEIGAKRLGGGPSGRATACTLVSRIWAIAGGSPKGVSAQMLIRPDAPRHGTFDGQVHGYVQVHNSGRTTWVVAPELQYAFEGCGPELRGEALTAPGDALAVNPSRGLTASNDPAKADWSALREGVEFRPTGDTTGARPWASAAAPCPSRGAHAAVLAPGKTIEFDVAISTDSLLPGSDPSLPAGTYDVRATFLIRRATKDDIRAVNDPNRRLLVPAVSPTPAGTRSDAWQSVSVTPAPLTLTD